MKTDRQALLEAQRGQSIETIVREALEKYRGRRNMVMLVSVDLEISDATLYRWCDDLGINIREYREPAGRGS